MAFPRTSGCTAGIRWDSFPLVPKGIGGICFAGVLLCEDIGIADMRCRAAQCCQDTNERIPRPGVEVIKDCFSDLDKSIPDLKIGASPDHNNVFLVLPEETSL